MSAPRHTADFFRPSPKDATAPTIAPPDASHQNADHNTEEFIVIAKSPAAAATPSRVTINARMSVS